MHTLYHSILFCYCTVTITMMLYDVLMWDGVYEKPWPAWHGAVLLSCCPGPWLVSGARPGGYRKTLLTSHAFKFSTAKMADVRGLRNRNHSNCQPRTFDKGNPPLKNNNNNNIGDAGAVTLLNNIIIIMILYYIGLVLLSSAQLCFVRLLATLSCGYRMAG